MKSFTPGIQEIPEVQYLGGFDNQSLQLCLHDYLLRVSVTLKRTVYCLGFNGMLYLQECFTKMYEKIQEEDWERKYFFITCDINVAYFHTLCNYTPSLIENPNYFNERFSSLYTPNSGLSIGKLHGLSIIHTTGVGCLKMPSSMEDVVASELDIIQIHNTRSPRIVYEYSHKYQMLAILFNLTNLSHLEHKEQLMKICVNDILGRFGKVVPEVIPAKIQKSLQIANGMTMFKKGIEKYNKAMFAKLSSLPLERKTILNTITSKQWEIRDLKSKRDAIINYRDRIIKNIFESIERLKINPMIQQTLFDSNGVCLITKPLTFQLYDSQNDRIRLFKADSYIFEFDPALNELPIITALQIDKSRSCFHPFSISSKNKPSLGGYTILYGETLESVWNLLADGKIDAVTELLLEFLTNIPENTRVAKLTQSEWEEITEKEGEINAN